MTAYIPASNLRRSARAKLARNTLFVRPEDARQAARNATRLAKDCQSEEIAAQYRNAARDLHAEARYLATLDTAALVDNAGAWTAAQVQP